MNPHDEMDITAYLQTEGRRLAAARAAAARAGQALPVQPVQSVQSADGEPRALQADENAGIKPPKSLGEVLQGMGVTARQAPHDLKRLIPMKPSKPSEPTKPLKPSKNPQGSNDVPRRAQL